MTKPENTDNSIDGRDIQPEKEQNEIVYESREDLDAQLSGVISEILSAEQEAKLIIAKAEENVKAIRQDGATTARSMREASARTVAVAREQKLRDATRRAEDERARRIKLAEDQGKKLVAEKQKMIDSQIDRLFASIGGKA